MIVRRLEVVNFRNYRQATVVLDAAVTALVGNNGQGKTNLVEAIGWMATMESFRGAPNEALVRVGCDQAIVRADIEHDDGRALLLECEINRSGRNRVLVNKQRLQRSRDLLGVLRVSVFSPDDLDLIKDGPGLRRTFLDTTLVALTPRIDAELRDLDRILRQRNVLLKQAAGRLSDDIALSLDVWDSKLAAVGEIIGNARAALVADLTPVVCTAYRDLVGIDVPIALTYDPPWRSGGLEIALRATRSDDLRRQLSLVGPHRDDLDIALGSMSARTHASQGEQRSLALALKLAAHRLITDRIGSAPLLVLDDVLSELDPGRASALLGHLPVGQVLLTTASGLPKDAGAATVMSIVNGTVSA
jgi:DNA replication and repair protein RecF